MKKLIAKIYLSVVTVLILTVTIIEAFTKDNPFAMFTFLFFAVALFAYSVSWAIDTLLKDKE